MIVHFSIQQTFTQTVDKDYHYQMLLCNTVSCLYNDLVDIIPVLLVNKYDLRNCSISQAANISAADTSFPLMKFPCVNQSVSTSSSALTTSFSSLAILSGWTSLPSKIGKTT